MLLLIKTILHLLVGNVHKYAQFLVKYRIVNINLKVVTKKYLANEFTQNFVKNLILKRRTEKSKFLFLVLKLR